MARRVLVVSPHPDDEAIGCGGTLCKHAASGDAVHVLFLTSGEAGSHGRLPASETAALREGEARDAAAILGVAAFDFWRLPDGRLRVTAALVDRLARTIRAHAPALVYVPNEREAHRDHVAAARLVRRALARIRRRAPEVRTFEVWTPLVRMSAVVDVTPHIDAKMAAIRAYRSQCDVLRFDDAFLGLARYRGEMFAWPRAKQGDGRYAEVFGTLST